jgi:hypothetical protein
VFPALGCLIFANRPSWGNATSLSDGMCTDLGLKKFDITMPKGNEFGRFQVNTMGMDVTARAQENDQCIVPCVKAGLVDGEACLHSSRDTDDDINDPNDVDFDDGVNDGVNDGFHDLDARRLLSRQDRFPHCKVMGTCP